MFEILLRKIFWKHMSKEEQDVSMIFKDRAKIIFINIFLFAILCELPLILIYVLSDINETFIFCVIYLISFICFNEKLKEPMNVVETILYFYIYTIKGKAISKKDFKTMKRENKYLYNDIMKQACRGYCYYYCFDILQFLKKGEIRFIAIRDFEHDDIDKKYTIHVLYINNNWCFDPLSVKQYPVEELMQILKWKTFTSFTYEDVADKTYPQFKEENFLALNKWCEENHCYQKWKKI